MPEKEAVMQIFNPWEQEGIRIGEERGMRRGEATVIARLLTRRFGALPVALREQIENLPQEKLEQLADAVLEFATLNDVHSWLTDVKSKS